MSKRAPPPSSSSSSSSPPPPRISGGVIHVDCDSFFLAVHAASPGESFDLDAGPAVLWQYRDVVCANHHAKRLGVKKHMEPSEARKLVEAVPGGRMVHAYWRDWPGPRVWYGPYNRASRQLMAALRRLSAPGAVLESASIDEAYVDAPCLGRSELCLGLRRRRRPPGLPSSGGFPSSGGALHVCPCAEAQASRFARELAASAGFHIPVSIGVGSNRLLAKLGSKLAKPQQDGGGLYVARTDADVETLLRRTAPATLPGLGGKKAELDAIGAASSVLELRGRPADELQRDLRLPTRAAAEVVVAQSRGEDGTAVQPVRPKSLSVTSWTTHTTLGMLALKHHTGRGSRAGAVTIGRRGVEYTVGDSNAATSSSSSGKAMACFASTSGWWYRSSRTSLSK